MRIAVLMGGTSPEREVSLESGRCVAEALESNGHEVRAIDFDRLAIDELLEFDPDAVFIALHGCPGEDGTVQGLMEILCLPYTGSGVLGSATAMDKGVTKRLLQSAGLPICPGVTVGPGVNPEAAIGNMTQMGFTYPVIVKPCRGGSTIGMSIAHSQDELRNGLIESQKYDNYSLIEQFINGPEITVSILDDRVLPSIEIVSESGFYDYDAKYTEGKSRHVVPPRIDPGAVQFAEDCVLNGFHQLQLSGLARAEVMFNEDGRPHILEYNTVPGFTPLSLFPDAAKHAGIEFPELCEKLVEIAIRDRGGRRIK